MSTYEKIATYNKESRQLRAMADSTKNPILKIFYAIEAGVKETKVRRLLTTLFAMPQEASVLSKEWG